VSASTFVHLHTHSTHSPRDGLALVPGLVAAATADGQPALAITDHGNLAASWRFAKAARAAGIKPIMGIEAYLAHGSRFERQEAPAASDDAMSTGEEDGSGATKRSKYHHLTLLAATKAGWRNLAVLDALAHEPDAFWSKPRIDMGLLSQHSEGLICLTGCLGGPVLAPLAAGDNERAEANLAQLQEIFEDRLYVEVMDHGVPGERRLNGQLLELAHSHGLPVVATNDSHYVHRDEARAHDAWLCTGSDATLDDPGRWRFQGEGYWLRSSAEMHELFDTQPGTGRAVAMALEVAERIEDDVLPESRTRLPAVPDADATLKRHVKQGARKRFAARMERGEDGKLRLPADVVSRLDHELRVITSAHLSDYFLLVEEMISWARSKGIRVGYGRGSAAGSLVAYCLGIVGVDPLEHHLLFERFLSPDRVGLPDIDTDFEQRAVPMVIEHLGERWGSDKVARIGTYGIALSRASLKLAGKVMGQSDLGARLAKAVPTGPGGKPYAFSELMVDDKSTEPFRSILSAGGQDAAELVEIARTFEGQVNAETIHACGVVVADEPLLGMVPLRRDSRDGRSTAVTEWDGHDVEDVGLVKLDVLGLRNLDIVSSAVQLIRRTTGEEVGTDEIPESPSDPRAAAAWRLIGEGRTAGVFQLESRGMTKLAVRIAPKSLAELSDIIALFRPGPLSAGMHNVYAERHGRRQVDYGIFTKDAREAAEIASVLSGTYGVPIYQEQLMRLGEVVAGFGAVTRDRLRKAVAKKIPEEMTAVGELFVSGAQSATDEAGAPKLVFRRSTAEKLWDAIKGAGSYAFNASHSLGYAKLAYVTAFLKANWPSQFAAAVLANTDKEEQRIATFRSMSAEGIEVRGPDVNLSDVLTTVDQDGAVRVGLGEVGGVGEQAGRAIVAERLSNGPYASVLDVVTRVKVPSERNKPPHKLPINTVEALVEAGAFDAFGPRLGQVQLAHSGKSSTVPPVEWGVVERAARERRRLKVILTQSPLKATNKAVKTWVSEGHLQDPVISVGRALSTTGVVSVVGVLARADIARKGVRRANVTIEGSSASIDGVIWSDKLSELEAAGIEIEELVGTIVGVTGNVKAFSRYASYDTSPDDDSDETVNEERNEITVYELVVVPVADNPQLALPGVVLPDTSVEAPTDAPEAA
jgi:DNA polymerase-3 subunit alpha